MVRLEYDTIKGKVELQNDYYFFLSVSVFFQFCICIYFFAGCAVKLWLILWKIWTVWIILIKSKQFIYFSRYITHIKNKEKMKTIRCIQFWMTLFARVLLLKALWSHETNVHPSFVVSPLKNRTTFNRFILFLILAQPAVLDVGIIPFRRSWSDVAMAC